jgi:PEP-CTERM motif
MKLNTLAVAAALSLTVAGGRADASVVIDIFQNGGNVVAMGGGTIDLNGLTLFDSSAHSGAPAVEPNVGLVFVGPDADIDAYTGISGPMSFGTGGPTSGSSGSGDTFGVNAAPDIVNSSLLIVPTGYTSGTTLAGSSIYDGQTLASLGLTPGTYVYTWNRSPAQDDSLTVKIGSIPEPATWATMLLGFAALGFAGFRATRRSAARAA